MMGELDVPDANSALLYGGILVMHGHGAYGHALLLLLLLIQYTMYAVMMPWMTAGHII